MPSWKLAQKLRASVTYNGEARKRDSDLIIEETWDEDLATRDMYFYDWYHDSNKTTLNNLNPINDKNKIKMRCKFIRSASKTYAKDPVTYHLQLKPSQKNVVPYYDEMFKNRYGAMYPVGLYVDIQDASGTFNRWLVVGEANINDPQFPTYELLRCDYVVQYIFKGTKYNVPGVLRSQNS